MTTDERPQYEERKSVKLVWFPTRTLKVMSICMAVATLFSLGLAGYALYSARNDVRASFVREEQLRDQVTCLQEANTEFNEAVAFSIDILLQLNDANTDLNASSIELNASLIEALVSLGRQEPGELQAALDRADLILSRVSPYLDRAAQLAHEADSVEQALSAALRERERVLQSC